VQQRSQAGWIGVQKWEVIFSRAHTIDPSLRELVDRAVPLTEYAWKFRYPGEADEPTRQEAQDALAIARDVYEAILARLPMD